MNITKNVPLEKWTAYFAPLPKDSPKEHRIIIIYHTDVEVSFFWITSNEYSKTRLRDDSKALVEVFKHEWGNLTKDVSFIQCDRDHLEKISVQEFQKMYEDNLLKYLVRYP